MELGGGGYTVQQYPKKRSVPETYKNNDCTNVRCKVERHGMELEAQNRQKTLFEGIGRKCGPVQISTEQN